MSIGLLATGDELAVGDTLNTNTQKIAQVLHSENISPNFHLTCGDDEADILCCMQFLCDHHNTLIVTGGLGPTSDDRTRYALAKLIGQPLIEFPELITHITERLAGVRLPMTPENRQQALFPAHAQILPNPNGTAAGCYVTWESHHVFLLPGPPQECLPMFEDYILPILKEKHARSHLTTHKWLLFGVAEGAIAAKLDHLLADTDCQTGYRLDTPYLEFKVHCKPERLQSIETLINPIVTPYMLTPHHKKASIQLAEFIAEHRIAVNITDKLTGGHLQSEVQRPDNVAWLSFDGRGNFEGERVISIEISGLEHYWQQESGSHNTNATITCSQNERILYQRTEIMPFHYRNHALVRLFATEWASAKILHILVSIK